MIFQVGEKYRIYPPGSLWEYHGQDIVWLTDEGEHLFSMAEGRITWVIPPYLLKEYKFVKDENTKRDEA